MLKFEVGKTLDLKIHKDKLTKKYSKKYIKSVNVYGKKTTKPKISVNIVAYNEGDGLIECLERLSKQSEKSFEIILVDNGLSTETKAKLKKFNLTHIVAKDNLGCTHGRNVGAPYSSSPLLLFIDADGLVDENYVETALKIMEDKKVLAARGKVLPLEQTKSNMPAHYDQGDKVIPSIISTEGNSIWRKDIYLKSGGYDELLAGGEGVVLCYRIHELYEDRIDAFIYDPSLVLYHDFHSNKKHLRKKLRQQAIIKQSIKNVFPLIDEYSKTYAALRTYRANINPKLGEVAISQKRIVAKEFEKYYDSLKEKRLNNPSLVKSQKKYKFSVVIPCYNLGRQAWDAAESALRQSIDSVEVIVVDDNSPDTYTQESLDRLEKHVKVIRKKKNGGVSTARNTGVKVAKSKYVLCLDADDTIEPTYLEKAYNLFELDEKIGAVSGWVELYGWRNGYWKPKDNPEMIDCLVSSPVPTASCFRKSAWKDVGGYDSNLRGYEDWNHWIGIKKEGWNIRVLPEIVFNYFTARNTKVNTSNKNAVSLMSRIIENHSDEFKKHHQEIIAIKHRQIAELRTQNNNLTSKNILSLIAASPPLRPLAIPSKKLVSKMGKARKELEKVDSNQEKLEIIKRKTQILFHKIKNKIR